jgi:hypothetical protein
LTGSEVYHVSEDILVDLVRASVFDVNIDRRIVLHELLDVGREVVQSDRIDCRNADRSGDDVFDLLDLIVQLLVGLDDLLTVFVEDAAFAGEAELLLAPLDQHAGEILLQ